MGERERVGEEEREGESIGSPYSEACCMARSLYHFLLCFLDACRPLSWFAHLFGRAYPSAAS